MVNLALSLYFLGSSPKREQTLTKRQTRKRKRNDEEPAVVPNNNIPHNADADVTSTTTASSSSRATLVRLVDTLSDTEKGKVRKGDLPLPHITDNEYEAADEDDKFFLDLKRKAAAPKFSLVDA